MKSIFLGTIAVLLCTYLPFGTVNAQQCTVTGANLAQAKSNYARQCTLPRRDCDPVNGQWACSSANITSNTILNSGVGSTSSASNTSSSGGFPSYATRKQPWSDSYSVNGQCYCDSTFDHGAGSIRVSTPVGTRTVRQVCDAVRSRHGQGSTRNRVYYNTIQCGHQPRNTAADERVCPGIPINNGNYSGRYCQSKGSTWNLNTVFNPFSQITQAPTNNTSSGACTATGNNLTQARNNYARQCSLPRRDCDPRNGQWICSSGRL